MGSSRRPHVKLQQRASNSPEASQSWAPRILPISGTTSSLRVCSSLPPLPSPQQQLDSGGIFTSCPSLAPAAACQRAPGLLLSLAPAAGRQQQADCGLLTTSCSSSIKVYSGAIKFYLMGSRSLQATDFSILVFFCMLFLTNFHLCYVFDK